MNVVICSEISLSFYQCTKQIGNNNLIVRVCSNAPNVGSYKTLPQQDPQLRLSLTICIPYWDEPPGQDHSLGNITLFQNLHHFPFLSCTCQQERWCGNHSLIWRLLLNFNTARASYNIKMKGHSILLINNFFYYHEMKNVLNYTKDPGPTQMPTMWNCHKTWWEMLPPHMFTGGQRNLQTCIFSPAHLCNQEHWCQSLKDLKQPCWLTHILEQSESSELFTHWRNLMGL